MYALSVVGLTRYNTITVLYRGINIVYISGSGS